MLRLREIREQRNISQTTVANDLHISRQSYNFYENGQRDPNTDTLIALADYFGVSVDYLLNRNPLEEKEKTVDEATAMYNQLSPEDKEKVDSYIQFLASQK